VPCGIESNPLIDGQTSTVFCLYFATNLRVFGVIWKPHRMRRLARIKTGAENKRHTNAHQPFTDHSPTEVSIPPSPPLSFNGRTVVIKLVSPIRLEPVSFSNIFQLPGHCVSVKCRQFSVLGFTRGSLGSSNSATELRPLDVSDVRRNRFSVQRFQSLTRLHSSQCCGDSKQACNSI
jgi:hypothetical protein